MSRRFWKKNGEQDEQHPHHDGDHRQGAGDVAFPSRHCDVPLRPRVPGFHCKNKTFLNAFRFVLVLVEPRIMIPKTKRNCCGWFMRAPGRQSETWHMGILTRILTRQCPFWLHENCVMLKTVLGTMLAGVPAAPASASPLSRWKCLPECSTKRTSYPRRK